MNISEATEIMESNSVSAVNIKLANGWFLLAVVPAITAGNGTSFVTYVLGRKR